MKHLPHNVRILKENFPALAQLFAVIIGAETVVEGKIRHKQPPKELTYNVSPRAQGQHKPHTQPRVYLDTGEEEKNVLSILEINKNREEF